MAVTRPMQVTDEDRAYIRGVFPEVADMADLELANQVVDIWAEVWKESPWERIEDAPKNPETVDPRHKVVAHTRSVTQQAVALAKINQEFHEVPINHDFLIAGGLLHDVSKLMEYAPEPGGAGKSHFGHVIQHGMYAVHKAFAHDLPLDLVHIIACHTTQSGIPPKTVEGILLYYADYADSDTLLWKSGRPLLLNKCF